MEHYLRQDTWLPKFSNAWRLWQKTLKQGGKAYLRKYRREGKAMWRVRVQKNPA